MIHTIETPRSLLYWEDEANQCQSGALPGLVTRTVRAADGYPLRVYEMGARHGRAVVLLNAPGMPFFVMGPLARQLSTALRVICVEARGCPVEQDGFRDADADIECQAGDLLAVLAALELQRCEAVTWSSGAYVLLCAMERQPGLFGTAVLMAPNALTETIIETGFQRFFFPLFGDAVRAGPAKVERLRTMVHASQRAIDGARALERQAQRLSTLFIRSSEMTRRYAHYFQGALDYAPRARALYQRLSAGRAFHFIHAGDDTFTDYREAIAAYEQALDGSVTVPRRGGHHLLYTHGAVVATTVRACIDYDDVRAGEPAGAGA
jgi:pimeloyl-ACP methyl ester carboxylesterase